MSQDPKTWCDHENSACVLGRPDDDEAHARLADAVAELDDHRAETFPALLGVDDLKARAAAADWLDVIRVSLTGNDTTEDYGTGNYLLTDVLMTERLEAHGLAGQEARDVVYALAWYAIGAAAATAGEERLRLEPQAITHIRYRPQAAVLLNVAASGLRPEVPDPCQDDDGPGPAHEKTSDEAMSFSELPAPPPSTEGPAFAGRPLPRSFALRPAGKTFDLGFKSNPTNASERDEAAQMAGTLKAALEQVENGLRGSELQTQFQVGYVHAGYAGDPARLLSSVSDRCTDSSVFVMQAMPRVPGASRQLSLAALALQVAAHALAAAGQIALGPSKWDEQRIEDGSENALTVVGFLADYARKATRDFDADADTIARNRDAFYQAGESGQ